MAEAGKPALSVIVPVHDAAATLPAVVAALRAGLSPSDEIIAVDDRSADGSAELCASLGLRVIPSDRPPGAAGTRNCGARAASGDWLLFVDSDAVPPAGWRGALAAEMPSADALQAVYAREAPGTSAATFYKNYYYHYTFTRRIRSRLIPGCGTFFFAVRRRLFESLGGFDEKIAGATVEDADFAARLTATGAGILLLRDLEILHLRQYTLAGLLGYDWRMVGAKVRYIMRRDVSHGRLSLSMAGATEMLPVAAGALAPWAAAGFGAAYALGMPAGLPLAAAMLAVLAFSQLPFWVACIREGGVRGLAACLVSIPDLALMLPAAAAAVVGSLTGRRY